MPGSWTGEIVGSHRLKIGQQSDRETEDPVEFSYLLMPVVVSGPKGKGPVPGVLTIFAPTGRERKSPSVGTLQEVPLGPSVALSFDATRTQFSDIAAALRSSGKATLRFTIEPPIDSAWQVKNWAIASR